MLRPQAHGLLLLAAVLTLGATACTATAGQTPTNVPIAAPSAVTARAPSPGPSPSPVRTATPVRFSGPTFILIRAAGITAGVRPRRPVEWLTISALREATSRCNAAPHGAAFP